MDTLLYRILKGLMIGTIASLILIGFTLPIIDCPILKGDAAYAYSYSYDVYVYHDSGGWFSDPDIPVAGATVKLFGHNGHLPYYEDVDDDLIAQGTTNDDGLYHLDFSFDYSRLDCYYIVEHSSYYAKRYPNSGYERLRDEDHEPVDLTNFNVYDNDPPTSEVSALPPYSAMPFNVYWEGADALGGPLNSEGSGLQSYDVEYKDSSQGTWTALDGKTGRTDTSTTFFVGAHNSTYYFRCRARDNNDNEEAWPASPDDYDTYTTVDLEVPESSITMESTRYSPDTWNQGGDPSIKGAANDTLSGINEVRLYIFKRDPIVEYWDGSSWDSFPPFPYVVANGTTSWTYDLPKEALTDGTTYYVRSHALDNAGNLQPLYSEHAFTYDSTPPDISNTSAGDITNTSATISWDTNEPATGAIEYKKDEDASYTYKLVNSGPFTTHSITLTDLEDGPTYLFHVISTDEAGNTSVSDNSSFTTIANLSPAVLYVDPTEVDFAVELGGTLPLPSYLITIENNGESPLNWEASNIPAWLNLDETGGTLNSNEDITITVSIGNIEGLEVGTYYTSIAIEDDAADGSPKYITVNLEISEPQSPAPVPSAVSIPSGVARNHPNPFDPTKDGETKIIFNASAPQVKVILYDLRGKALWTKTATPVSGNYYEVPWDGKSDFGGYVGNGSYIYLVVANGKVLSRGQLAVWK